MRPSSFLLGAAFLLPLFGVAMAPACAAQHDSAAPTPTSLDAGPTDTGVSFDSALPDVAFDISDGARDTAPPPDPTSCDEARITHSNIGCDFWPTVVANGVWNVFDFAAIVANAGDSDARVSVTGPGGFTKDVIVGPNRLVKVYLPWVTALKGPEGDNCGSSSGLTGSVRADKSAYHLVSTKPVTVWQFNALEYKGEGGAPGKAWTECPGNKNCVQPDGTLVGPLGCFSFTNDASLLLPSTALTGNYRITGQHGALGESPYIAITAAFDGTEVVLKLSTHARILLGDGVPAIAAGKEGKFTMNQGDVLELLSGANASSDLSGSVIQATKPVQVIAGVPCIQQPAGVQACDHIEESVFPAETFGQHYIVTVPTAPDGTTVGHIVRIYGNVDGTNLTWKPVPPKGAPATLDAGQVVDLGIVKDDFEVTGDAAFAVGSFQLGGELVDPTAFAGEQRGDPSESMLAAVEQYRLKYVFLAPDDYDVNYVDVAGPVGTVLMLDGAKVTDTETAIGSGGFAVRRLRLGKGEAGAHLLTADRPVGIQVMGYGLYTSYQYPGGLNLQPIAPPPK